jgi:rod shape-determining protein MreD
VRRGLAVLVLGIGMVVMQSALGTILPVHLVPDLGLLVTVAAALLLGPAEGLLVAAAVGFGADMLSGALLGQHAALRLCELALTRGLAAQLDLRRPIPLAIYTGGLYLLDALGMAGLARVFLGAFPVTLHDLAAVAARAAVTALFAPALAGAARSLVRWIGEEESRREMRLDTRRPLL